jgi:hypothetical protein
MFAQRHRAGPHASKKSGAKRSREFLLVLIFLLSALLVYRHFALMRVLARVHEADNRSASQTAFKPGELWVDEGGSPIQVACEDVIALWDRCQGEERWRSPAFKPLCVQAHGGSVLLHDGTYYWYGEDKSGPTYVPRQAEPNKWVSASSLAQWQAPRSSAFLACRHHLGVLVLSEETDAFWPFQVQPSPGGHHWGTLLLVGRPVELEG